MSLTQWYYGRVVSKLQENRLSVGVSEEDCGGLMNAVAETAALGGDIAEVGVAEGGSAAIICEINDLINKKPVYLFDTFKGLPNLGPQDSESAFKEGMYFADFKRVKDFFSGYKNVKVYKGLFPQKTGKRVVDKQFSFVHLDVDLYKSTYDCLDFFWPKIVQGGILISHDYQTEKGIRDAFGDYFRGSVNIEVPRKSQCLIRKV